MFKTLLEIYYHFCYFKNKYLLKIIGVKFGTNLQTFSYNFGCPHQIRIGQDVWIGKNVSLQGLNGIEIGDQVLIAAGVRIISFDHGLDDLGIPIVQQPPIKTNRPVVIGSNVWLAENAIILKGVTIGDGAVVGAGSVVTKDVPPNAIVAGNPAHLLRYRGQTK